MEIKYIEIDDIDRARGERRAVPLISFLFTFATRLPLWSNAPFTAFDICDILLSSPRAHPKRRRRKKNTRQKEIEKKGKAGNMTCSN
jgi:hypothetical protein